ncbi:MAG: ArsR/SmtB family transcription factor [Thermocrispum sp.]
MRGPDPTERHITLTAEALRVLAHPLRARLLSALRSGGPATATELAAVLQTNTGATSYHLRKLAEVGLVTEVGGQPGRQRRWRAAQESHGWVDSDLPDDPDAAAASAWLRRHYWQQLTEKVARWEEYRAEWPVAWRDAAGMSDALLELDPGELEELTAELLAVLRRYRGRPARAGRTRAVSVYLNALPVDPASPATPPS